MKENEQIPPENKIGLQVLLPLFPTEATIFNSVIGVQSNGESAYYFNGSKPIFNHKESDI